MFGFLWQCYTCTGLNVNKMQGRRQSTGNRTLQTYDDHLSSCSVLTLVKTVSRHQNSAPAMQSVFSAPCPAIYCCIPSCVACSMQRQNGVGLGGTGSCQEPSLPAILRGPAFNLSCTRNLGYLFSAAIPILWGHAVAQLVEALRYKPEGPGFDSRWCHWNFSLT